MIIRRIVENWREAVRMDLRRSVKPYFKGCSSNYLSFRSGSETYLTIDYKGIALEFIQELGQLVVSIDGVDARESPLFADDIKNKLTILLSSNNLSASERNNRVAQLISHNLK